MWENLKLQANFGTNDPGAEQEELNAQPTIFLNKDIDPDVRAKSLGLQAKNGLPVETIEADLSAFEKEDAFNSFSLDDYSDSPITMAGLAHPQESPIYKDDAQNLSLWEKFISGVDQSWRAGQRQATQRDIWMRRFHGIATEEDDIIDKRLEAEGRNYKPGGNFENFFAQIPAQLTEMMPLYLQAMAESKEETLVGGAAGAMAGVPAAGLAVGFGYGTMIEMGKTEAYLAYQEYSKMKDAAGAPIDDAAAKGAAAIVGLMNGSVEILGGKVLAKVTGMGDIAARFSKENIRDLMKIPSMRKVFTQFGTVIGAGMMGESVVEAWQELNTAIVGQELAAMFNASAAPLVAASWSDSVNRIGQAGRAGAQGGVGFGGPHAALGALVDSAQSVSLNRNAALTKEIAGLMEGSKTFQRMPQKWREHIAAVKEEYGVSNDVSVPLNVMETYFQDAGITMEAAAAQIPKTAEAIRKAQSTGSDVAIPLDEYAEYFARSENFQPHVPDVRLHPQLPTDREAAEMRRTMLDMAANVPVKDNTILDDIRAKIEGAEGPGVAEFQALLHYHWYDTQAQELGIPIAEIYKQQTVDIERSGFAGPDTAALVDMVQKGEVPTDSQIYGPSLQEFIQQYGDNATTREEAVSRGYFDTTELTDITDAKWQQALADKTPRYAYGAEDTGKLQTREQVAALQKHAEAMGVDLHAAPPDAVAGKLNSGKLAQAGEQVSRKISAIESIDPVEISGDGTSRQDTREVYKGIDTVTFSDGVKAKLTGRAFKKISHHRNGSEILRLIPSFPELANRAVLAYSEGQRRPEHKANISAYHNYVSKAVIGGEPYFVRFTLQEVNKPDIDNELYNTTLSNVELTKAAISGDLSGLSSPAKSQNSSLDTKLIQWLADVKDDPDTLLQGEGAPRGFITMNRARDYFKITLTGSANLSTFLHESGHLFLEMMNNLASRKDAPARIVNDMQAIRKWLGMKPGEEFTVEHHEKWARGFEAYLMEGNAPSAELRSAFSRFKAWLTGVYKDIVNLGVPLTDEVRGVMDRMFASQEAINRTAELEKLTPIFGDHTVAGMTELEFAEYMLDFSEGMTEAEDNLFRRLVDEITAHEKSQHREAARQIKTEVADEVKGRPVYQAYHFLKTGTLLDGTIPSGGMLDKLDREILTRMFPGIQFSGKLAKTTKVDGADPTVVASFFGFKTADEMISAIVESPSMAQVIKEETQTRLKAVFGDSFNPRDIADLARKSLHNTDRIAGMIKKEIWALNRMIKKVVPDGFYRAMQQFADEQIENTEIGKIQPHLYNVAEQRYGKAAFEAAAKKDWVAAAEAKRNQLMNYWLYRKAVAAKEEANKIRNYLHEFESTKRRKKLGLAGGYYLEAVDALLEGVELANKSLKGLRRRSSLASYLERMEADGQIVTIPEELRDETRLRNYRTMTVADFRGLRDAVKNINHLATLKNKLRLSKDKRDFREIMDEINLNIQARIPELSAGRKQNPTAWEAGMAKLRGLDAQLVKVEFLIRQLDGMIGGKLHSVIFEPLVRAQARKYDMLKDFNKRLYEPLRRMPKEQKARMAAEYTFHGTKMKGHEIMAVALNMGNESNIKKLIEGYGTRGYTEESLMKELDRILTKEDWQMVQHIWDQVNSLWPMIVDVQKRNTGLEPAKVEPRKIVSRHGIFNGGYYPIFYDKNRTYKALADAQKSNNIFENNYMAPKVGSGFTIERTAYSAPLLLSLDGLPRHINDVVHYLTHFDAVTQANRVINDKDFQVTVSQAIGREYYNELKPWLQNIANEGKSDMLSDFADNFARHLSTGLSIMTMGFSLSTSLIQILGLTSSLSELGPRYLVTGMKGMFSPTQRKFALANSSELRHTIQTFDRDARAAYAQMLAMISGDAAGKAKYYHAQVTNFAFSLMGLIQQQANIATWIGAYNKACAEGVVNAKAAADSTVRLTQSGGGAKDLARIQRPDKPFRKLITPFYTYFSVLYGQLRAAGQRMPKEPAVAMAQLATLVLLPTLIEQLLKNGLPDDDEPADEWLKSYAQGVASFGIAPFPIIRDFIQPFVSNRSYAMAPGATILTNALNAAKAAAGDEDMTASQIKALARGLGVFLHLPANQFIKTASYFDKLFDGEVEEPVREFFFGVKYKK